jgi:hypothetical protein
MRNNHLIVGALSLMMGACFQTYAPEGPSTPPPPPPVPETANGSSTEKLPVRPIDPSQDAADFLDSGDASRLLDIISVEGTPDQASRLHACMKMRFDTLGRLLAGRGVTFTGYTLPVTSATTCPAPTGAITTAQKASFLYCDARVTLGLPQYPARIAESPVQTSASAVKMHDLFLAAADDIIAAFGTGTSPANCRVNGAAVKLFEADNTCSKDGVSCILGFPPGADLLNLCNQLVAGADGGAAAGKRIAVGALLAVANMCE